MEFKVKRPRHESISDIYTIPITEKQRHAIDKMKHDMNLDVNAMFRDFIQQLIVASEKLEAEQPQAIRNL